MSEIDLQDQFMNTTSEAHSFQDGAFIGFIAALFITGAEIIIIIGMALGFGSVKLGKKEVLKKSINLTRTDEILNAPEYFVLGFVTTFVTTAGFILVSESFILPLI